MVPVVLGQQQKRWALGAIGVTGDIRTPLMPDLPTFAEQGFAEVPANAWFGLFAPAGTPREVIALLQTEVTRMLKEPEFVQKEVLAKGYELVASTAGEFAAFLVGDAKRSAQAVKISGARAE